MKGRPFERENEGIDDDDDHELFAVAEVLVVVGRRRDDNDAANPLREEIMRGVDIIRFIIEISTGVLDRNRSRLFVAQASNILWRFHRFWIFIRYIAVNCYGLSYLIFIILIE